MVFLVNPMKTQVVVFAISLFASVLCTKIDINISQGDFSVKTDADDRDDSIINASKLMQRIQNDYMNSEILKYYYSKIQKILDKRSKSGAHTSEFRSSIDELLGCFETVRTPSELLYPLFKDCTYLVNPLYFKSYQEALNSNRFDNCYYILRRTVDPTNEVEKYIEFLNKRSEQKVADTKIGIFVSTNDAYISIDIENEKPKEMVAADITLDLSKIYKMDLWQRRELLEAVFEKHYNSILKDGRSAKDKIIKKCEKIFRNGSTKDIKFTSFILYQLYSELISTVSSSNVISRIEKMIELYETDDVPTSVLILIDFFVKITSYGN